MCRRFSRINLTRVVISTAVCSGRRNWTFFYFPYSTWQCVVEVWLDLNRAKVEEKMQFAISCLLTRLPRGMSVRRNVTRLLVVLGSKQSDSLGGESFSGSTCI
jgi:hypothetical protein